MRPLIFVFIWMVSSTTGHAFNWGNTVNEGSIIIDNSVVSGSSSSSSGGIRGSGNLITEQRKLGVFTKLAISVVADVRIISGKRYHMSIEGDDNIVKIISNDIINKQLTITSRKSYSAQQPLKINIEVPFLTGIKQSGTGSIFFDNISRDSLAIKMSGSGTMSGKGQVGTLNARISGSGTLNVQQLAAHKVIIKVSGVGEANVQALDKLDVAVQGMGNITYSGNPKSVNKSITGLGKVRPR